MADEFYNPYHFVPADGVEKQEPVADLGPGRWPAEKRHDRYGKDLLHGRLTCRLRLQTPLVVGAAHTSPENEQNEKKETDRHADERESESNDYTKVEPYRLNGRIAIPATSLKGMLSSVVEAASRSAMRVLADTKPITWRQPAMSGLSALGRLERDHDGNLKLRPLTGPTIEIGSDIGKWHRLFCGNIPLKMHFGFYPGPNKNVNYDPQVFKKSVNFQGPENAWRNPSREAVYYAKVVATIPFDQNGNNLLRYQTDILDIKKGRFIVGQKQANLRPRGRKRVCHQDELPADHQQQGLVRGFLRVLGGLDREMPPTKRHEIFIPFPEDQIARSLLPIKEKALDHFIDLADERSEAAKSDVRRAKTKPERLRIARPYSPFASTDEMRKDREPACRDGTSKVRLREGQILYFDFEEREDGQRFVTRLSFSAIWRDGMWHNDPIAGGESGGQRRSARPVSMRELFAHHDPDLVPMGPGRQHVTPAEWLFGFVEERTGEDEVADRDGRKRRAAVAYRGRVRLSPGRLVQPPDDEEILYVEGDAFRDGEHPRGFVRLKELSSPKPPSPPLYFEKSQGGGFPHHQLKIDHRPKGRKLYLHHREPDYRTEAGNADADAAKHRKMAVRPLKEEPVNQCGGFAFHIDFENLSRHELDLLCWALRPSDDFRHKLGLGKPLGLGSIEIEIEELALIDRHRRYAEENPFDGGRSRYRWTWTAADGSSDGCEAPSSRRQRWSAWMEERCPDAYAALMTLGESHRLPQPATPVAYPVAHDQPQEEKLFQWHANNKRWWELGKGQRQWLDELGSGRSIRPLRKNRGR